MERVNNLYAHDDFDGLISSFLIKKRFPKIKKIVWISPKDIEHIRFTKQDILVDLPYSKRVGLYFDHHPQGNKRTLNGRVNPHSKSCARVIWEYYQFKDYENLVNAADKIDSADIKIEEMDNPSPESIISLCLKSFNSHRDNCLKRFILRLLDQGVPLSDIAKTEIIQRGYESRKENSLRIMRRLHPYMVKKGKIGFIIVDISNERCYPSTSLLLRLSKRYDYSHFIMIIDGIKNSNKVLIKISKNIFNKKTINLRKIIKPFGGSGREDKCVLIVKNDKKDEIIDKIIGQIVEVLDG